MCLFGQNNSEGPYFLCSCLQSLAVLHFYLNFKSAVVLLDFLFFFLTEGLHEFCALSPLIGLLLRGRWLGSFFPRGHISAPLFHSPCRYSCGYGLVGG